MASGQTQYYGLSQWEAADKVERVDFNSDNAKIDGALRALAEQAGRKADKSTVTNLSSVVSQKADKTALTAAEKRVSALERGKAEQVALDGAVSQLREENRMVFLGRTALNTAASSFVTTCGEAGRSNCPSTMVRLIMCPPWGPPERPSG